LRFLENVPCREILSAREARQIKSRSNPRPGSAKIAEGELGYPPVELEELLPLPLLPLPLLDEELVDAGLASEASSVLKDDRIDCWL